MWRAFGIVVVAASLVACSRSGAPLPSAAAPSTTPFAPASTYLTPEAPPLPSGPPGIPRDADPPYGIPSTPPRPDPPLPPVEGVARPKGLILIRSGTNLVFVRDGMVGPPLMTDVPADAAYLGFVDDEAGGSVLLFVPETGRDRGSVFYLARGRFQPAQG